MTLEERKRDGSEGNLPTRECRGKDKSGQRKKAFKRETLTSWRAQKKGQAKTEKKQDSEGHSLPEEHRGSDKSRD
jgi:hypothetical protein